MTRQIRFLFLDIEICYHRYAKPFLLLNPRILFLNKNAANIWREKSQNNQNRLRFFFFFKSCYHRKWYTVTTVTTGNRFLLAMSSSTWYQTPLPLLTLDKKILLYIPFESFHLSLQVWISCYYGLHKPANLKFF